jgi:hypothetical protein
MSKQIIISGVYTMAKITPTNGFLKHRKYFFVIQNALA